MSLPYSGQFVAVTSYKKKPMEHTNIKPEAAQQMGCCRTDIFNSVYSTEKAAQLIPKRRDDVKKTKYMKLWDLLAHLEGPRQKNVHLLKISLFVQIGGD